MISKRNKNFNRIILLPIILYPFIFFGTIFFFDDPSANPIKVWLLFFAVNAYPLYLYILYKLNLKIYAKNAKLGHLLPLAFIALFAFVIFKEIGDSRRYKREREQKEILRKQAGYLGHCKTYKLVNDSLFYRNTFIKTTEQEVSLINCQYAKDSFHVYREERTIDQADPFTFERLNRLWQKDKNRLYYGGLAIDYVDYNSFEVLDANYSKDKNSVYYYQNVLEGAKAESFKVDPMTNKGSDGVNEYHFGKLVQ